MIYYLKIAILLVLPPYIAACASEEDPCTKTAWYKDADADGLGDPSSTVSACEQPEGYVSNSDDDNDTSAVDCAVLIGPPDRQKEAVPIALNIRGECSETLPFTPAVSFTEEGTQRTITSNSIPAHKVGVFGAGEGAINPNAIAEFQGTYSVPLNPTLSGTVTHIFDKKLGPQYEFGILLSGILLDPEAAEPWPHSGFPGPGINWEWNLDAMTINLGLDCNNAHVQPSGKYHHHGAPTLYFESLATSASTMIHVGYAADGFPIYYKYGFTDANDSSSNVKELTSSFVLKQGKRPGDGVAAPCGDYTGIYTNDWEYKSGSGDLDECNGRMGVTPEFPNGTYHYVITENFPFLSRCLKGTPSKDFELGR